MHFYDCKSQPWEKYHMRDISLTSVSYKLILKGSCTMLTTQIVPYAPTSPFMGSSDQQPRVIGPASTLKLVAKTSGVNPLPESDPSAIPKGQHWVDLMEDGTVVVIEQPGGQTCAALGGILALRLKIKGAKGCVVGGRVRDLSELKSCGLPVSFPKSVCPGQIVRAYSSLDDLSSVEYLAGHFASVSYLAPS